MIPLLEYRENTRHVGHAVIERPNMRYYVKAAELKQAQQAGFEPDWKNSLLKAWLKPTTALVARLLADPSYRSEQERIEAFREPCQKTCAGLPATGRWDESETLNRRLTDLHCPPPRDCFTRGPILIL